MCGWFSAAIAPSRAAALAPKVEARVLAAAAGFLPLARRKGLWGLALYGGAVIAGSVLVAPHASPVPAVLTAWGTCAVLVLWQTRERWVPRTRALVPEAVRQLDG